jgi:hypothetical protein
MAPQKTVGASERLAILRYRSHEGGPEEHDARRHRHALDEQCLRANVSVSASFSGACSPRTQR